MCSWFQKLLTEGREEIQREVRDPQYNYLTFVENALYQRNAASWKFICYQLWYVIFLLQLTKLQEENDSLVGIHSRTSQQMQEESINLPNTVEELHLLLLKYREDIIAAKVAKEHIADTKKSEILFLKDQIVSEQQERTRLEESLTNEISNMQEELGEWHKVDQSSISIVSVS